MTHAINLPEKTIQLSPLTHGRQQIPTQHRTHDLPLTAETIMNDSSGFPLYTDNIPRILSFWGGKNRFNNIMDARFLSKLSEFGEQ